MPRRKPTDLFTWAALAIPGAVGIYAAQAVAGLPLLRSIAVAATVGAAAGFAWCLLVVLIRRRNR
jgi:hypothetical protein